MGDTPESLSPIGFGAFKIGRNTGTKYAGEYALPDSTAVSRLLNGVLDLGVNLIDTAPAYGASEERIGAAISHRRAEFALSTKVGETFEDGQSSFDFSAAAVRNSVQRSLRRLRTEAVDFLFVHASRDDSRILSETDVVPALQKCRDDGLTRRIGFSGYTAEAFGAALPWADAIMVEYHLEDRSLEPIMAQAADQSISVIVKKGLASGRLPAAEAVRFVLTNPAVASLIVGSLEVEHIAANCRVASEVRVGMP